MTLDELKAQVIEARKLNDKLHDEKKQLWNAVMETEPYRKHEEADKRYQAASQAMTAAEEALRIAALDLYKTDGNKNPTVGVVIKIFETLKYDAKDAAAWCKDNAQYLFKFDARGFEKAKPDGAPIEIVQEPRCQLGTKLE
jgi:hypothetical protein